MITQVGAILLPSSVGEGTELSKAKRKRKKKGKKSKQKSKMCTCAFACNFFLCLLSIF